MKNGKLQIGIIGCGGIANQKHMPALSKLKDKAEMVAFCDIIEERAVEAARKYGAPDAKVYTDYKDILEDKSIDAVNVLTPNVSHSQITVDALYAGKHVMCEKPMAHTSADAQRMLDAASHTGLKLTIGYQNRFRDDVQTIYKACRGGMLGDIYMSKAHAVRRRAVPTWGVFLDKSKQGGGPLIDIGTHALDLTLWFMNNYKPVSVTGSVFHKMADQCEANPFGPWDPATFDVEDSAFGFIKMENGATIFLESSWILNTTDVREACTSLYGTKAGVEMFGGMGKNRSTLFNTVKLGKPFEERPMDLNQIDFFEGDKIETEADREAKQWLDAILNDTEPIVKPEQAFVVTRILEAIYTSASTGKTVEF